MTIKLINAVDKESETPADNKHSNDYALARNIYGTSEHNPYTSGLKTYIDEYGYERVSLF